MNNIAFISDHDWLGYSIEIAITYIDLKHQGMASKTIDKLKADFNIKMIHLFTMVMLCIFINKH